MRVPGGPSLGETPVTSGWFLGAILSHSVRLNRLFNNQYDNSPVAVALCVLLSST